MKMDQQKFERRCAIKFCIKLGESTTVTYEKLQGLRENIPYPGHKSFLEDKNKWKTKLMREDLQPQKRTTMWKE